MTSMISVRSVIYPGAVERSFTDHGTLQIIQLGEYFQVFSSQPSIHDSFSSQVIGGKFPQRPCSWPIREMVLSQSLIQAQSTALDVSRVDQKFHSLLRKSCQGSATDSASSMNLHAMSSLCLLTITLSVSSGEFSMCELRD